MLYETDAGDLIEFAKRWAELGDAVAEQVADVVDNPQTDEVNPAAIELARRHLQGLNQGIDLAIDEYLTRYREQAWCPSCATPSQPRSPGPGRPPEARGP